MKTTESNRIEYKQELTDKLEKEVIAFLNYREGGIIYLGIDKNGNKIGGGLFLGEKRNNDSRTPG